MSLDRRAFTRSLGAAALLGLAEPRILFGSQAGTVTGTLAFRPSQFGATGDGRANDTQCVQKTIDACAAAGGGLVLLETGKTYLVGSLTLKDHVHFHLPENSRLLASPNREEYHKTGALLFAEGAKNVRVSGRGEIDGNFRFFFPPKGPEGYPVPQPFLGPYDPLYESSNRNPPDGRPRMILLVDCRNVLLEEFTIRDSPTWTIHPIGCEDLHITGISILNDLDVPNCDGIDIDHCRNVRIDGCNIIAGDDCIVLKASRNFGQYGPCEGVTVTGCTLESSSAGIKIETEGPFPLRSALITSCTIVRSNRGISFLNRDGATVEDILFSNLTIETRMRPKMWWGSGEPVALSSVPRKKGGPAGLVRGVTFSNLLCRGENGLYLRGFPSAPLRDVHLNNVDLRIEKTTGIQGGFYDMRPGDMFGDEGFDRRANAGVFAADVAGLSLQDIHVSWSGTSPAYYGPALELHQCTELAMGNVTGKAAQAGQPPTIFDGVSQAHNLSQDMPGPAAR